MYVLIYFYISTAYMNIYDIYIYYIYVHIFMYVHKFVVVACDPIHTLWRVATAVRMRNDHWHAWTKKPWRISLHLPIWTVFRQQWWAAPVWYFPKLGIQKKQNPWYVYTYIIYIFFFCVEGFRMLLRRLIWEQHTQIFPSCCGFHIDSLCHILLNTSPRWRAPGWGWNWLEWCRVGMVDWFWIGILRIWNMSYMFFFGRYFTYIIECCLFMIVCWYYTNIKYYFHH